MRKPSHQYRYRVQIKFSMHNAFLYTDNRDKAVKECRKQAEVFRGREITVYDTVDGLYTFTKKAPKAAQ